MPAESLEKFKSEPTPEQAGGEFYESAKAKSRPPKRFEPDFEKDLGEKTANLLEFPDRKPDTDEGHHQAGILLPHKTRTEHEAVEHVNKLLSGELTPFEMNAELERLSEEQKAA